jgi:hypothetical protein
MRHDLQALMPHNTAEVEMTKVSPLSGKRVRSKTSMPFWFRSVFS